jgi:cytoskeleton protein RodZ
VGLGDTLRQAREALGYSLDQAAQATRIRRSYLAALERDDLEALPPPTFARGILRSYAQFLNLDPAPLLDLMPTAEQVEIQSPTPVSLGSWRPQGNWAVGALVVGLLVTTLLYLQGLAAPASDTGLLVLDLPTPTATPLPTATPASAESTPTPGPTPATTPTPTRTPSPSPSPTPTPTQAALVVAVVPNVVGQPFLSAEATLRGAGFNVQRQEQAGGSAGQVLSQEPAGGQSVAPGTTVTLRVATGASNQVTVPEVVGRPEAEARELLRRAGLNPSPWTNYQDLESLPPELRKPVCAGCVLSTSPPGGSQVTPGTTINLAVRRS